MIRLATVLLGLAAVAAGAAAADGPGASGSGNALFAPDGRMYTTSVHSRQTVLSLWRDTHTHTARKVVLPGSFGFPLPVPTTTGPPEGLSHDGRTLVLTAAARSRFLVLDSRSLRVLRTVDLHGRFTYDALSPDARTLFLIQSVTRPANHYHVRGYDIARGRLLAQIIFDVREKGEGPMSGRPLTRATGPNGRWVYTLYTRSNRSLFVHALDTVDRHAYCIDVPKRVSHAQAWRMRLKLRNGNLRVDADWATRPVAVIDTKTLRLRR